jgi:hypothetical protein
MQQDEHDHDQGDDHDNDRTHGNDHDHDSGQNDHDQHDPDNTHFDNDRPTNESGGPSLGYSRENGSNYHLLDKSELESIGIKEKSQTHLMSEKELDFSAHEKNDSFLDRLKANSIVRCLTTDTTPTTTCELIKDTVKTLEKVKEAYDYFKDKYDTTKEVIDLVSKGVVPERWIKEALTPGTAQAPEPTQAEKEALQFYEQHHVEIEKALNTPLGPIYKDLKFEEPNSYYPRP